MKNAWSPALNLQKAILSVQQLLLSPEPDDPQDAVVAGHYRRNYADFKATARAWTKCFAINDSQIEDKDIQKAKLEPKAVRSLMSMGFESSVAMCALQKAGTEDAALELLLT